VNAAPSDALQQARVALDGGAIEAIPSMSKTKKIDHTQYPIKNSIGHLISVINRKLQPILEMKVRDQGVTYGTWFFLRALWEEDGISQVDLAKRVATSAPSTVAAIGKMKQAGLVTVRKDPQDARKIIVSLTDKGRGLEEILLPRLDDYNRALLRGLTKTQVKQLREMLRVIQANTGLD
jgi:DNA-binding MarR family transcriptional regulator